MSENFSKSDLLDIKDISVSYGAIKALRNVSMSVTQGDIVCLIGANGAGKSTLLKAIVGLEPLVSGSIVFDGDIIAYPAHPDKKQEKEELKANRRLPTNKIAQLGISLVPEGRHVFTDLTVEENLDMGAFMVKEDAVIRRKKEEMYDFFPILGQRRKQKAGSLSGGEQQMMAIARAMMSSPRLLLLDEPGLGLAPLIIQDIFQKIAYLNAEEKITVFLVEQNAKMALRASSRGYVMETGNIVLSGSGVDLLNNEQVKKAYLGE